jgi:hypothetical protein
LWGRLAQRLLQKSFHPPLPEEQAGDRSLRSRLCKGDGYQLASLASSS